ncbi:oligosaccharide repeat unit polymerase [Porphyromonadaceae bacterium KH3CP3RA]|nr:oligosaccharide repeat unit polymerase [Porphyromonadaceae bacterium KH3CP3RA]
MELIIYLLFFLFLFFYNYKKYGFNGGTFVISIYGIGVICGVYLLAFTDLYDPERLKISAIVYHCICLYLFLWPIIFMANKINGNYSMPNKQGMKIYNIIIIVLSIGTYILSIPKILNILKFDDLSMARNMYNYGMLYEEQNSGFIDYIGSYGSALAYFALYLFFYYLVNYPERKKLIVIMLLCSFTDAITSLTLVGRGGIIRWLFMFLFFYFIFKDKIDQRLLKKMRRIMVIASSPLLIVFLLITFSRFLGREYPIHVYMIDYIGQSYIYFSYIFDDFFTSTFDGRMNFPILFPGSEISRVLSEEVSTDYNLNTFATFIGSFYKDMGFVRTILLSFIFWILFLLLYKYNPKRNSFVNLNLMVIISQIIINGIFYFQYTSTTKMKMFAVIILLALFLQLIFPRKKKIAHYISPEENMVKEG